MEGAEPALDVHGVPAGAQAAALQRAELGGRVRASCDHLMEGVLQSHGIVVRSLVLRSRGQGRVTGGSPGTATQQVSQKSWARLGGPDSTSPSCSKASGKSPVPVFISLQEGGWIRSGCANEVQVLPQPRLASLRLIITSPRKLGTKPRRQLFTDTIKSRQHPLGSATRQCRPGLEPMPTLSVLQMQLRDDRETGHVPCTKPCISPLTGMGRVRKTAGQGGKMLGLLRSHCVSRQHVQNSQVQNCRTYIPRNAAHQPIHS